MDYLEEPTSYHLTFLFTHSTQICNLYYLNIHIIDKALLDELGVTNVMAIKDGTTTFLLNKESRQAVSGMYLVDMDGLNGSTLTVEEDEVRVVGRVALIMEKC